MEYTLNLTEEEMELLIVSLNTIDLMALNGEIGKYFLSAQALKNKAAKVYSDENCRAADAWRN